MLLKFSQVPQSLSTRVDQEIVLLSFYPEPSKIVVYSIKLWYMGEKIVEQIRNTAAQINQVHPNVTEMFGSWKKCHPCDIVQLIC